MSGGKTDILGLTLAELTEELVRRGEKPYRARQLYTWLHQRLETEPERMSNLPRSIREWLAAEGGLYPLQPVTVQTSRLDGTKKYLFELSDRNRIETVWMKYHHGNSVCISSQVGCAMGCSFCASTLGGLVRSLTAAELLGQVYAVLRDTGERVSNIVVMGIGEPLENYEALVRFLRMISEEHGQHISQRSLTVSTCGIAPQIERLAEEGLSVTLALSLHAATDEKRRRIMPVAQRYTIAELMAACDHYFQKTGRRISLEYALIAGVNDTVEDAAQLARLAVPRGCHINLIPVNPVTERGWREPERAAVEAFCRRLTERGANATIRRSLGRDIDGACGQLRRNAGTAQRGFASF